MPEPHSVHGDAHASLQQAPSTQALDWHSYPSWHGVPASSVGMQKPSSWEGQLPAAQSLQVPLKQVSALGQSTPTQAVSTHRPSKQRSLEGQGTPLHALGAQSPWTQSVPSGHSTPTQAASSQRPR